MADLFLAIMAIINLIVYNETGENTYLLIGVGLSFVVLALFVIDMVDAAIDREIERDNEKREEKKDNDNHHSDEE